jgi:hypothetical protein
VRSRGATSSALIHSAPGDRLAGLGRSRGTSTTGVPASSSTIGDTITATSLQIASTAADATSSHGTTARLMSGRSPAPLAKRIDDPLLPTRVHEGLQLVGFVINGTSLQLMEGTSRPIRARPRAAAPHLEQARVLIQGCATTLNMDRRSCLACGLPCRIPEVGCTIGSPVQRSRKRGCTSSRRAESTPQAGNGASRSQW